MVDSPFSSILLAEQIAVNSDDIHIATFNNLSTVNYPLKLSLINVKTCSQPKCADSHDTT